MKIKMIKNIYSEPTEFIITGGTKINNIRKLLFKEDLDITDYCPSGDCSSNCDSSICTLEWNYNTAGDMYGGHSKFSDFISNSDKVCFKPTLFEIGDMASEFNYGDNKKVIIEKPQSPPIGHIEDSFGAGPSLIGLASSYSLYQLFNPLEDNPSIYGFVFYGDLPSNTEWSVRTEGGSPPEEESGFFITSGIDLHVVTFTANNVGQNNNIYIKITPPTGTNLRSAIGYLDIDEINFMGSIETDLENPNFNNLNIKEYYLYPLIIGHDKVNIANMYASASPNLEITQIKINNANFISKSTDTVNITVYGYQNYLSKRNNCGDIVIQDGVDIVCDLSSTAFASPPEKIVVAVVGTNIAKTYFKPLSSLLNSPLFSYKNNFMSISTTDEEQVLKEYPEFVLGQTISSLYRELAGCHDFKIYLISDFDGLTPMLGEMYHIDDIIVQDMFDISRYSTLPGDYPVADLIIINKTGISVDDNNVIYLGTNTVSSLSEITCGTGNIDGGNYVVQPSFSNIFGKVYNTDPTFLNVVYKNCTANLPIFDLYAGTTTENYVGFLTAYKIGNYNKVYFNYDITLSDIGNNPELGRVLISLMLWSTKKVI